MMNYSPKIRFLKHALLAACFYVMWYFSSSDFISPTVKWMITAILFLLLISFQIWDYRIKKRKVPTITPYTLIMSIILAVIFICIYSIFF